MNSFANLNKNNLFLNNLQNKLNKSISKSFFFFGKNFAINFFYKILLKMLVTKYILIIAIQNIYILSNIFISKYILKLIFELFINNYGTQLIFHAKLYGIVCAIFFFLFYLLIRAHQKKNNEKYEIIQFPN